MGSNWNGKITKESADGKILEQWFFSPIDDFYFVSGYRKFQKKEDGTLVTTARCFPQSHHKCQNAIGINEVPLPPDIIERVSEKTGTDKIRRNKLP